MTTKFNANSDYKTAFAAEVDALWATDTNAKIAELQSEIRQREKQGEGILAKQSQLRKLFESKRQAVADLTDAYVRDIGERPDSKHIDRLATWLLKGAEHADTESLVLTANQRKYRKEREKSYEYIEEHDNDGNRRIEPKPTDSDGGNEFRQRVFVKFPHDNADLREFNGNVRKYRLET